MSEFIALLGAVTIDDSNDTIQLDEGGVVAAATVAHGTYWPRGNGSGEDLLQAVATALGAAFGGGNSYSVTLTTDGTTPSLCIDPSAASAKVYVARSSGSTSFRVRWLHTGTTFDVGLLGFAAEKLAVSAAAEVSTLSPACIWVHNDRHVDLVPGVSWVVAHEELDNGGAHAVRRSDAADRRRLMLEMVDGRRMWPHRITADPARAWASFVERYNDGGSIQVHELDLQSVTSTLLAAPTRSSRVATDNASLWMLDLESAEGVDAKRVRTGMDHWDLDVLLRGVVSDPEEVLPPAPSAMLVYIEAEDLDGFDNESLTPNVSRLASMVNHGTLGGTAVQAVSTGQPLFVVDDRGRAAIEFVGAAGGSVNHDWVDIALSSPIAQPITIAIVFAGLANGQTNSLVQTVGGSTQASGGNPLIARNASGWYSSVNTSFSMNLNGSPTLDSYDAVVASINGASSTIRKNDPAGSDTAGSTGTNSAATILRIGANTATPGAFASWGRIARIGIWQGSGRATITQAMQWLVDKGGSYPQ